MWTLHSLTKFNYVETIISQQLSSPDESIQMAAFNAFGNLWRLTGKALQVYHHERSVLTYIPTDDEHLPARALVAPLFLVLDATNSDNLATRAAAQAWMRCHFKSYLRMVDPIVLIITDPSIQRTPVQLTSGPCTVQLFQYTEPFDSNRTHYALSLLQTLFLTRGAAFMRTVRSTSLKQSTDPDVRLRGDSGKPALRCL